MRLDQLLPERTKQLRRDSFVSFTCDCGYTFTIEKFGRDVLPGLRILKDQDPDEDE